MSFSEWYKIKLGDISEIIGGGTPSTSKSEYWGNNISWLTPRDLSNYNYRYISKGERSITNIGLKNSSARLLPKNTILLTSRAPIGYLAIAENDICTNQGFKSFIADESKVDYKFLYYLLKNNIETLKQLGTGTTFAEISASTIKNIEVSIPKIETQRNIANILSSLDDKIELNRQTNQTLETLAQTLFKEMCLPKSEVLLDGWEVSKLGEVVEIKYGKNHKHLEDGDIPVYGSGGIMRYANKSLYEKESILIPRKGTLSNLFYINKPFWSVDTMFYTKINNETHVKFLFLLLKSMNLASMNVGSAVPSLTTEILNNLEIILPSEEVLKEFNGLVTPVFKTLELNIEENQTLISLRDSLLPKLMKGEIAL